MVFGQRWIFALLLLCVAPVQAELQIEIVKEWKTLRRLHSALCLARRWAGA